MHFLENISSKLLVGLKKNNSTDVALGWKMWESS